LCAPFSFNPATKSHVTPTVKAEEKEKTMPDQENQNLQDGNAAGDGKKAEKTFTQDQVDAILVERLGRKERATTESILAALGTKDLDEAKALILAQKQSEVEKQSTEDRLKAQIQEAEDRTKEIQKDADEQIAAMQKRILDSELRIKASQAVTGKQKLEGKEVDVVVRPAFKTEALDDVLLLVDRSKIADKDGKYEGVDEALNDLAKAKPYLLADDPKPAGKGSPGAGKNTEAGNEGGPVGVKPQHYRL
jgi:hypothetical protein